MSSIIQEKAPITQSAETTALSYGSTTTDTTTTATPLKKTNLPEYHAKALVSRNLPPLFISTSTPSPPTATVIDLNKTLLAAQSGDSTAQIQLGDLYRDGTTDGVEQDYQEAMSWFEKAVVQDNNATAQHKIAHLYLNGLGTPQNDSQACEWYLKSAEQGNALAQFRIRCCYRGNTATVEKNCKVSLEWFLKAAERGMVEAQYMAGFLYKDDPHVNDDKKAMGWLMKAAGQGYPDAMDSIGEIYLAGKGGVVPKDVVMASEWFRKAAEQGCAYAQTKLGTLYRFDTDGFTQDHAQAVQWFQKSAAQGYTLGQIHLGSAYCYGEGVEKDYQKAMELYMRGAYEGKDATSMALVGGMYHMGKGVRPDLRKAKEFFERALEMEPEHELVTKLLRDLEADIREEEEHGWVEYTLSSKPLEAVVDGVAGLLKKLW